LRAEVFELVAELDLLGHGDTVLGHFRRTPALFERHVAAARPECDADSVGEAVDAAQDASLGV
jgi:hypothetical protein